MSEIKKKKETQFHIQGDGNQSRSFIYVDDFTSGLLVLLNHAENLQIYNIGTTNEITIRDLALIIAKLFHLPIDIVTGKLTQGSPQRRCPDITQIQKLGFSPKIDLEEGLTKTIAWYV